MNNIITDNSGRIGTSEMTRYGMREAEMEQIASLIGDIFNNKLDVKSVKDIDKMRNDFSEVLFADYNKYKILNFIHTCVT